MEGKNSSIDCNRIPSPIPAKLQTMSFVNQLKAAFTEIRNSFSLPNIIKLHFQGELMSQYIWSLLQLSLQQDKQNNPRPPEPSWSERAQRLSVGSGHRTPGMQSQLGHLLGNYARFFIYLASLLHL